MPVETDNFSDRIAVFLSRIFQPFYIVIPAGLLLLWLDGLTIYEAGKWVLLSATLSVIPIGIYVGHHKYFRGLDTNIREARNRLYVMALLSTTAVIILLTSLNGPKIMVSGAYAGFLLVAIGAVINRKTKISIHAGVLGGFSTAFASYSLELGLAAYTLTAAVMWSRLRLGRHTVRQLLLGFSIATLVVFLSLWLV